jgi:predicted transcriptional regulator of viral defense system
MHAADSGMNVASNATITHPRARLGPVELALLAQIDRSARVVVRLDRDHVVFDGFGAVSRRQALARLERAGWLHRLERGAYVLLGAAGLNTRAMLAIVADWLEGANYAVAGTAALAHWDLTGHAPSAIEILIDRKKRPVIYRGMTFEFIVTDPELLGDPRAIRTVRVQGARAPLRIVGPERALLAAAVGRHAPSLALAAAALDRGMRYRKFNYRRLVAQARRQQAGARRIGWLAEHRHDHALAKALARHVGRGGYVPLDPRADLEGAPLNSRWRVIENANYDDLIG